MSAPVVVTLSPDHLELVNLLVDARNTEKEARGVPSKKILDHVSEAGTHELGIAGTVSVGSYFGELPSLYVSLEGDKGHSDLVIGGLDVEVKTRRQVGWDFALMEPDLGKLDEHPWDIGVLVYHLRGWTFQIHGVISQARFVNVWEQKNYGHGPRAVAEPHHFSHPSALTRWLIGDIEEPTYDNRVL